ncbi:kinesin-like protein KIN-10A [Syzygium oleosum]|uniref:kinesin-like protein KIN-10A n=1 Tax=Syzygium oleosum TaxID=219896 RepID=UPI0011D2A1E6|nr:kinesin-like protein KIN-10A [Syzygium oleosum]
MAPTPTPTPSSSSSKSSQPHTASKTPQSKHRLHFNGPRSAHPSPHPGSAQKEAPAGDHPVEVVGRIRDCPDRKERPPSVLQVNQDGRTVRVRAEFGYRDFSLDGVSLSEEEDLDSFYKKFVGSRIDGVKLGAKCTIMMYGPTGSGKSHTMFGCSKQPGIVYRSLKDILGENGEEGGANGGQLGVGTFVQVTVLEIYNEEIYDLLSSNGGGFGVGWPKGGSSKVRLEVMGKKAKNAAFISGNEAGKISREIQKVEKRRIVKSTLCNERSSRSHCMIILDVPTVGGRLMLVDMAGSENIEQAGQVGFEAKMQTAKINQGNVALKRVVESIANGDSHVPFRDSKLTMLLQDSFEDDKSKILMILCASPDPKEIHKTISTLEYGAKAKCIVRGPHTPVKDRFGAEDSSAAEMLGSRIAAMDQFICKLQMENKLREKERNEAHKELLKKEQEVASLRTKLQLVEGKVSGTSEDEINMKVNERIHVLKTELEKKLAECQRMADEFVELERRRMEERIRQQQEEVEMLRRRLEEIESQLRNGKGNENGATDGEWSGFAKRLLGSFADEDPGMVKSMDLDMGDQDCYAREVKYVDNRVNRFDRSSNLSDLPNYSNTSTSNEVAAYDVYGSMFNDRVCLSTVFEEEEEVEEEEGHKEASDEEVEKGVIEEKRVCSITFPQGLSSDTVEPSNEKDVASSRRLRIQNIFTLCGNYREISQQIGTPLTEKRGSENADPQTTPFIMIKEDPLGKTLTKEILKNTPESAVGNQILSEVNTKSISQIQSPVLSTEPKEMKVADIQVTKSRAPIDLSLDLKENCDPSSDGSDEQIEVCVKWEASKENTGNIITTLKVVKDVTLADLRKLIEIYLGADNQAFTFLVLGDPTGAPVPREKEGMVLASKLPVWNNQLRYHLACLRPAKSIQCLNHVPLTPLENKLPLDPNTLLTQRGGGVSSPKLVQRLGSSPLVTPHSRLIS